MVYGSMGSEDMEGRRVLSREIGSEGERKGLGICVYGEKMGG